MTLTGSDWWSIMRRLKITILALLLFLSSSSLTIDAFGIIGGGQKLKLYTHPKTRSPLVSWYLKELNVAFQESNVAIETKEQKSSQFVENCNPFGQLPVLQVGANKNNCIFESGAILLYLAEQYGELRGKNPLEKATVSKWIFFANSSLANKVMQGAGRNGSPGWRIAMTPSLNVLEKQLSQEKSQQWLLTNNELGNNAISAADVAVGSLLLYTPVFHPGEYGLLKDYPNIVNYMERLSTRKAYQDAYNPERLELIADGIQGYRNPNKRKRKVGGAGWSLF